MSRAAVYGTTYQSVPQNSATPVPPLAARVINVSTSGLTRASIFGMRPGDFEAQGTLEVYADQVISRSIEARVAGAIETSFESLLMSRIKGIKDEVTRRPVQNESCILPYIYRRQKRNINSNYFKVLAGAATAGAGSGGVHAGSWDLTIGNPLSKYGSNLPSIEKYFLVGKQVVVEHITAAGAAVSGLFTITASVNADAGGVYKATLTLAPNNTTGSWAGLSAAEQFVFQPTTGFVMPLANSVSDYEAWAVNETAENPRNLLAYWLQTTRETFQYNDEYLKALNAALVSNYWKDFQQLPLAEQRRMQHMKSVRSWVNSVFYGQRITEKQDVATYDQLPTVTDPVSSETLEYKANALGFRQQLIDAGRYLDLQGGALNLAVLLAQLYDVKRAREATGGEVENIDIMCDRWTAGNILDAMVAFYKVKYGVSLERHYTPNQALMFENQVLFNYNVFQIPAELGGFTLNVFWHNFFGDKVTAFQGDPTNPNLAMGHRGRALWVIDWSDVELGIAKTNSVQRRTNEADELYYTRMAINVTHYQLNSTTWTAIMEDPSRSYIIENFSDAQPSGL